MRNSRVISSQQQRGILYLLFVTALLYYWICDEEHYFKISIFNTTRLQNDISFVEDMDLSTRIDCGTTKCFVPSVSNRDRGYLVQANTTDLGSLNAAFNNAKRIEKEFGGSHFYVDAPFIITLSNQEKEKFNRHAYLTLRNYHDSQFYQSPTVGVQKMIKAPDDTLYMACSWPNVQRFRLELDSFVARVHKTGNDKEFLENIEKSHDVAKRVFEAIPYLLLDFQGLFDIKGRLYFIDLDNENVINERNRKYLAKADDCLSKISRVKRHVKNYE